MHHNNKDIHIRKKLGKLLQSRTIRMRVAKRRRKSNLLRNIGCGSIGICLIFLLYIIFNLFTNCYYAMVTTEILVPLQIENTQNVQSIITKGVNIILRDEQTDKIISNSANWQLLDFIRDNPDSIGQNVEMWLTASSWFNDIVKHNRQSPIKEKLEKINRVKVTFNKNIFINADSQYSEYAGILGAMAGSLFTMFICCLCALPIGIMTGIYLNEFKLKNKFINSLIEISINNLSATPAIIFGIVGLYFYIFLIGVPRSSALVGGLVLSLMMLPIIVISTRQALSSMPNSIREAALALGASKMQVVLHHMIPYSFPGIITGAILGIARVLGESAPLLMVGMAAFISNIPKNILEPATVFPLQIYLWASQPDHIFEESNSVIILVLLVTLLLLNIIATIIRKKMHNTTHY